MVRLPRLLAVILFAGFLVVFGAQQAFTFLTNRSPKIYTVENYLEKQPSAKWLHLTGGEMKMMDMTYLNSNPYGPASIYEIYLPLRPLGAKDGEPDRILVKTRNPDLVQLAQDIMDAKKENDLPTRLANRGRTLKDLVIRRDVEGLIPGWKDRKDSDLDKIKKANPNLADNFIILEEGERPEPGSVFVFLFGIVLAGFLSRSFYKNFMSGLRQKPVPIR